MEEIKIEPSDPDDGPEVAGYLVIPVPENGDIVLVEQCLPPMVHWLHGPYTREEVDAAVRELCNSEVPCGMHVNFFYQPMADDPNQEPIQGAGQVVSGAQFN